MRLGGPVQFLPDSDGFSPHFAREHRLIEGSFPLRLRNPKNVVVAHREGLGTFSARRHHATPALNYKSLS